MSPQKNQSGEIVRSVWKQLFVKYGLCNSQWVEILSGGEKNLFIFVHIPEKLSVFILKFKFIFPIFSFLAKK